MAEALAPGAVTLPVAQGTAGKPLKKHLTRYALSGDDVRVSDVEGAAGGVVATEGLGVPDLVDAAVDALIVGIRWRIVVGIQSTHVKASGKSVESLRMMMFCSCSVLYVSCGSGLGLP